MTGAVCLQGGGEFSAGCRDMDRAVLAQAEGPVVVTALAGAVGHDYRTATANGVRHLQDLTSYAVVAAPDAREDPAGALAALRSARTVVLPGGSPSRLLAALQDTGAGEVVAQLLADGGTLVGSSAGAMVVCGWTVLPDRREGMAVVPGLGLVPELLVVPHWSAARGREDWLRVIEATVPHGVQVVGLPEESGILLREGALTAVGRAPVSLLTSQRELPPGQTERTP